MIEETGMPEILSDLGLYTRSGAAAREDQTSEIRERVSESERRKRKRDAYKPVSSTVTTHRHFKSLLNL